MALELAPGKPGEAPTLRHHREWMAEEMPFNAAQLAVYGVRVRWPV